MAAPVLAMSDVSEVYRMGEVQVEALRGVDASFAAGELVVLFGPSGSGKSTLLNIIGGLDAPTTGHVLYRDGNLTSADDRVLTRYRRDHVGFVFQFYNLVPTPTARENLALVTDLADRSFSMEQALELVGMGHRHDHFPLQLSGGEQQRVAIARAIAKRPDALLCDEPTGALDVATGTVVLAAIAQVNRELGATTALIQGRHPERGRPGEVPVNEPSVEKNGLRPGDGLYALVASTRIELRIVGVALSPEYVIGAINPRLAFERNWLESPGMGVAGVSLACSCGSGSQPAV